MRLHILLISAIILAPLTAPAADILLVQGNNSRALEQMTRLVQNDCATNNRTLVLSDYAEFDLARLLREERPSVLVAIGDQALATARKIRRVPVVYGMALNADEENLSRNVSGASMMVSPKSYLKLFTALKLHKIGVIYDRKRSGAYLNRAREAAESMGVELVTLQVHSSLEVQPRLVELGKRKVDAIWLLPDSTAISPEIVDNYFNFAQKHDLPVIGFSGAYLSKGALAAVELSKRELSDQICGKIRLSRNGENTGTTDSSTGKLLFNKAVAEKLRIKIPPLSTFAPSFTTDD